MLRLSVNFFCYFIFREENLLIYFLQENTYKMTHKMLLKHSKTTNKNKYSVCVYDSGSA